MKLDLIYIDLKFSENSQRNESEKKGTVLYKVKSIVFHLKLIPESVG